MRIGIDCDGVLRDFIPALIDSIKETHPQHADKILEPKSWDWEQWLPFWTEEETEKYVFETHYEDLFGPNANPIETSIEDWPKLVEWAKDNDHELILVSAQREQCKEITRHWLKKYPSIVAGKDEKMQGSWIGINDFGLVAVIHNGKINNLAKANTTRGQIILEVLNNASIAQALKYISHLDRFNYNNFNLLIADNNECHWIKHDINNQDLIIKKIKDGLSVVTDEDLNDKNNKKINFYYKLFSSIDPPNPSFDNWQTWKENLTNDSSYYLKDSEKICFIDYQNNYGTRSSSLIAIPQINKNKKKLIFKSTISFPKKNDYIDVLI